MCFIKAYTFIKISHIQRFGQEVGVRCWAGSGSAARVGAVEPGGRERATQGGRALFGLAGGGSQGMQEPQAQGKYWEGERYAQTAAVEHTAGLYGWNCSSFEISMKFALEFNLARLSSLLVNNPLPFKREKMLSGFAKFCISTFQIFHKL